MASETEYFITRFGEIAAANRWAEEASTLHLREALKGEAESDGRAVGVAAICEANRA